ncbi:MAG: ABC transporter ATP-binding protein [Thermomicrobiales bacterium]
MGATLQVRGLTKTFGEATAVDDVNLTVPAGQFVSLLGPSGCGKTTTLRIIAGLERADSGRILIDGKDYAQVPPQRRKIGMVFQQYALFPNLTTFENVAFALRVAREPQASVTARVHGLLDLVHLTEAANRYPHQLSGGMQQRVALARALAIEPPLLLLDEPLSALDAAIRDELRTELRRLQRQLDLTVVYVTHDQAEAMALSDTIVVMEKGKVSQVGTPQDLYDRPATRFTAAFVGSSNRRETVIERQLGGAAIAWGNARLPISATDLADGARVLAVWRPEAATLVDPAAAGPGALSGEIELLTFLGPVTRLDVRVDGDENPVIVDLVSESARHLEMGQPIGITVPPGAIRLYA